MSDSLPFPGSKTRTPRGNAVKIVGLPKKRHQEYRRAALLLGARSVSKHLDSLVRQVIRQAKERFGDLFSVLTPDEQDVLDAVASGAAEVAQIAEETGLTVKRLTNKQGRGVLDDLVARGVLEVRKRGGKTQSAAGAAIELYFVVESSGKK